MTAVGILAALADLGVRVEALGENLVLRGPVATVPEPLLDAARENKAALLDLLRRDRFDFGELADLGYRGDRDADGRYLVRMAPPEPREPDPATAGFAVHDGQVLRCRTCRSEITRDRWHGLCLNCFLNEGHRP